MPGYDSTGKIPPGDQDPWQLTQERLEKILDEHSYKNWFGQTRFESFADGHLIVGVPSQFFADWLKQNYHDAVTACASAVVPDFRTITFKPVGEHPARSAPTQRPAVRTVESKSPARLEGLNPRYVFERFVVGSGNRFAHAACRAVAESPARAYNPLFLYGGTGLGKTHLMHSIGHEILGRYPDMNIVFISTEDFTNQLIESIAKKTTSRFRTRFRKADVLLIDDIHFISGKEATQEEFFHTFNALFDMHKQIVISSDRQPKEIPGLEERLISRFEWGLVTDIQPPDLETRVAILQNKAAQENLIAPPEVLKYIATYITTNIRELEGALVTVLAFAKLTDRKITQSLAEEVLRDLIGRDRIQQVTVETIQKTVADHFDVRMSDLRGRSRQRQVSYPRQIAMFLCKELIPSHSLSEIGEAFGGKDHTTVLYACQKLAKDAAQNKETHQLLSVLERKIRQG